MIESYIERTKNYCKYNYYKNLSYNKYEEELKKWYYKKTKEKLNLTNPKNFNQKIQWLKLYDNTPEKQILADKYLMREWIEKNVDKKYLVNLIGVWNDYDEINFEKLPSKFVLKCNHGSGFNYIVNDKSCVDRKDMRNKFKKWVKKNYAFMNGFELQYKNIPPRIMCEEHLGDNLIDLQVWCSHDEIMFITYIKSPHGINEKASYNENWVRLDFVTSKPILKVDVEKPKCLDEIIVVAKKIAKDFKFSRIDFYILNDGTIKISEITFTPASGIVDWTPSTVNYEVGKMIKINDGSKNNE